MAAIGENGNVGPITRVTVVETLRHEPDGMRNVRDEDRDLVIHVLLTLAHQYERLGDTAVLDVLDYHTCYTVTITVPSGSVFLHHFQELAALSTTLVKKIQYDIGQQLVVVQVEKESTHNRTLIPRTPGGGIGKPRHSQKKRGGLLSSFLG